VTIRFSEEAIANWISRSTGRRGGQRLYSNLAIETSLTLRIVFGLPLRQAEGFVGSLLPCWASTTCRFRITARCLDDLGRSTWRRKRHSEVYRST